jgi:hypothetical protein
VVVEVRKGFLVWKILCGRNIYTTPAVMLPNIDSEVQPFGLICFMSETFIFVAERCKL